eukprot:scaffold1661_cov251-Pinguiococcus_pyrenoidosus.AAC.32
MRLLKRREALRIRLDQHGVPPVVLHEVPGVGQVTSIPGAKLDTPTPLSSSAGRKIAQEPIATVLAQPEDGLKDAIFPALARHVAAAGDGEPVLALPARWRSATEAFPIVHDRVNEASIFGRIASDQHRNPALPELFATSAAQGVRNGLFFPEYPL